MALAAAAEAAPEVFAKDALIGWYRGEFAAANAIIDALLSHISQMNGGDGSEYEPLHAAIHRRRMNWIPVLQMQKFCSIADVVVELKRLEFNHSVNVGNGIDVRSERSAVSYKKSEDGSVDSSGGADDQKVHCVSDSGSQEGELVDTWDNTKLCSDHEACTIRRESIKVVKGFQAREPIKGHMVNVVKGLKVYEEIFNGPELIKLSEFISDLRLAGHKGELSGETFIYFNKEMKGNKREIVQLGVPLFQTADQDSTKTEAIPPLIEDVIDHLVQWRLLPEGRRPNSCIISFFDEEEYSHPYFKPPHIDTPISTLVLSETKLAFGRMLSCDANSNYKGSLTVPLKEGSLLVMRGNSADMARHVVCPSNNKRVTISFVRVRPANNQLDPLQTPMQTTTASMALWQPLPQQVQNVQTEPVIAYAAPQVMYPTWAPVAAYNSVSAPMAMWAPGPMGSGPGPNAKDGTGVFLPWSTAPKRYTKHLPPRIQKRRHMRYSN